MVCHDILHYYSIMEDPIINREYLTNQSIQMQQVTKEIMYAQSNECNECNNVTNLKHMVNLIAQVYYGH